MAKLKINDCDIMTILASTYIKKEELDEFKGELEQYKNEIKRVEKLSKANSWKNSKKK